MQLPRTDTALLRNPDREVEQAGADREAINTGERKKKVQDHDVEGGKECRLYWKERVSFICHRHCHK